MRFKYPFIVDGAIAASAPIFQVAGIVSGEKFWNGVTEVRAMHVCTHAHYKCVHILGLHEVQ